MGVWIEILFAESLSIHTIVAPLVGVWIEIILEAPLTVGVEVAPLVGVWIEIKSFWTAYSRNMSRSPRGSVD